ncbi:hypothetical protein J4Q44_G00259200 [Coregonus suidteri]|uniref:Uncharacterized protein n=1 Tax=Coregonus suidteri TaxID=861788 RepID=A0AAN8LLN0_9TELE
MGNKPSTTTTTIAPTTVATTTSPTTTYIATTKLIDQRSISAEQIIIGLVTCFCVLLMVAASGLLVYTLWSKIALACGSKSKELDDETKTTDKPQVVVIKNEHVGKSKALMMDDHVIYSDLTILRANAKPSPATEMTEYASQQKAKQLPTPGEVNTRFSEEETK